MENLLKQPTFREDSFRTGSQIQGHFDVESVRYARLFVKAGCDR